MNENAKIDNNYKKTLLGVTDDASAEIRRILVDPTTGRLKCSALLTATFLSLSDTPSAYTGQSGKVVAVKATEDGLEFISAGTIDGSGTANELPYWVDSNTLGSLAVATYPSLTELSYAKGVTSAIQTQLGTKAPSTAPTFATSITGSYLTASEILISDGSKNIVSAPVATYPSLTELSYIKGLSSAVQTQIGNKAPSANPTFTGTVILPKTTEIQDTTGDHQYVLAVSELTADRTITLPLLTETDTFVFQAHTQTLTNKRIDKRVVSTANDATSVIDCDITDDYYLTAMSAATEISVTGTATNGQTIFIGLKDDGTTRALTWTGITALGVTLPTTTTVSKQHIIGIKYIASAWRAIAVGVEV